MRCKCREDISPNTRMRLAISNLMLMESIRFACYHYGRRINGLPVMESSRLVGFLPASNKSSPGSGGSLRTAQKEEIL